MTGAQLRTLCHAKSEIEMPRTEFEFLMVIESQKDLKLNVFLLGT